MDEKKGRKNPPSRAHGNCRQKLLSSGVFAPK